MAEKRSLPEPPDPTETVFPVLEDKGGASGGTTAAISVAGIAGNLVPATIGNVINGSLVAPAYGYVYARRP